MTEPVLPGLFEVTPRSVDRVPQPRGANATRRLGQIAASLHKENLWTDLLLCYRLYGPQTDAEVADRLGIMRSTVNARRNELVQLGKVEDSGQTRTNRTSGIANTLWRLRP